MRTALMLLLAVGAATGESATPATEMLKQRDAEIRALLPPAGQKITPEIRARLERVFASTVDMRAMAQEALGARWKQMSEKQRKRLLAAFEKRVRAIGGGEMGDYRSTKIEYLAEERVSEREVKVPTKLTVKGEPTDIDYLVRREPEGWRIVDVVVDGVSTVDNYRASFSRVIAKEGVDGLIARLEKGGAGPASKAGSAGR